MTTHHFARDRAPLDEGTIPTIWRYRWHCSCGAVGPWRTEGLDKVHMGWRGHSAVQFRTRIA